MSTRLQVKVSEWGAWAPARTRPAAWRAWATGESQSQVALDSHRDDTAPVALPTMLRRRVSALGQAALAAAIRCGATADQRYVFASRHGEFRRTLALLGSVLAGEVPSPAEFSLSVHHVHAGLLSIHDRNRRGHSAIAAGVDSFGFAFLEAATRIAEQPDEAVMLVYCDEPLDDAFAAYREESDGDLPLALAFRIGAADVNGGAVEFDCSPAAGPAASQSAALDFLRFLLSDAPVAESIGERMSWRWARVR